MATTTLGKKLSERGISYRSLAQETGVSVRHLHNLACGNQNSKRTRQTITDTLGVEVWEGILPTCIRFNRDEEIELESVADAKRHAKDFRLVQRRKNKIRFIETTRFVIPASNGDTLVEQVFTNPPAQVGTTTESL
jgi:transcriptional regulator with XRE-family HTH domain